MSVTNFFHRLMDVGKPRFSSTDVFPLSDAIADFDDSAEPRISRRSAQKAADKLHARQARRVPPGLLGCGYLLGVALFYALGMVAVDSLLVLIGVTAVLLLAYEGASRLAAAGKIASAWLKPTAVVVATLCMLAVAYVEPATQVLMAPFVFVTITYGLLTLSRAATWGLSGAILVGHAGVLVAHYLQDGGAALLRLETLHFVALALALPPYILLMERVQKLNRVLRQASRKIRNIEESAQRDALSGCFNRRYILAALEEQKQLADESGIPLCMAVLDLDRFKRINDELGHLGGDEVLRTFARVAQQNVRVDDIFGRYGGEEFLLIFPATPLLPALNTCERIRAQVEAYPWDEPLKGRVSVSIGVTQYVLGESVLEFFSRADQAMYLAKEGGRNQVVVEEPVTKGGKAAANEPDQFEHGYF